MTATERWCGSCGQAAGDLHLPGCGRYPAEVETWEAKDLPRGADDAARLARLIERGR